MTSFTDGPYTIEEQWSGSAIKAATRVVGYVRRRGHAHGRDGELADARLFAAAPSLVEYVQRRAEAGDPEAARLLELVRDGRQP